MSEKPDDIPQDVWDEAVRIYDETYLPNCADDVAIPVARAILSATAAERQRISHACEAQKYTKDQGMDQEMECFNDGLDAAIAITNQTTKEN